MCVCVCVWTATPPCARNGGKRETREERRQMRKARERKKKREKRREKGRRGRRERKEERYKRQREDIESKARERKAERGTTHRIGEKIEDNMELGTPPKKRTQGVMATDKKHPL